MKSKFLEEKITYDGSQLRSLYNYLEHDLHGDSIVSFVGPCSVTLDKMVDGEDKKMDATIASDEMLHFIVEVFHQNLFSAVCLQRLMADLVISSLKNLSKEDLVQSLVRRGDDIYATLNGEERKLSISIATSSPVSQLIHFAVNTTNQGTPVPTVCLKDFSVEAKDLASQVLNSVADEYEDIRSATMKVHWVK